MKHMRKLVTLVVVLAMVMAFMVPTAMAATITVQSVIDDETYTAYKILNYTQSGDAYSYYLTKDEYDLIGSVLDAAGFDFTASADGTQYFVNNAESIDAGAAAEYLAAHLTDLSDALGKFTAEGAGGQATFTGLTKGYYFVTTTTGSLCALHSDTDIATAVEKNTVPTIDKKQSATEGSYVDDVLHLNMGDKVYYQITVTDGVGTNHDITLTDTMTAGLTYTAGSIKINNTAAADDADETNYKITVSGQTITIVLNAGYVATLANENEVVITYSASVNTDAIVDSTSANNNKVVMTYSEQSFEDTVCVATYDVLLKKTDGTNALAGAKFNLYTTETGGTALNFGSDITGYYLFATGSEEIDAGNGTGVNIRGLKPGTYWLEEIVTPDGYNKLATRQKVEITAGATSAAEVTVENKAGTVLPSTGGMGTTIFYILGGLMVVGAAVVLVTNKRMRGQM